MDINNFLQEKEKMQRTLPIFILADISGSMEGAKIKQLNVSLRNMVNKLKNVKGVQGKFKLSIITFNNDVNVIQDLQDIDKINLPELQARGMTSMGAAFEKVIALIEDRNIVDSRSYAPTIVLMSDGAPTDFEGENEVDLKKWEPLCKLKQSPRSAKAQRLALAIGEDADEIVLKEFIGKTNIPLIKANNEQEIINFLNWVTMSVITRLKSINPNDTTTVAAFTNMGNPDELV